MGALYLGLRLDQRSLPCGKLLLLLRQLGNLRCQSALRKSL